MCVNLLMSKHVEGMSVSSSSLMITLDMIKFKDLDTKSNDLDKFKEFKAKSENQLSKHLKAL